MVGNTAISHIASMFYRPVDALQEVGQRAVFSHYGDVTARHGEMGMDPHIQRHLATTELSL